MNVEFLTGPVAQALGWALLHLLWQGALVAGILAATLALLSKQSAGVRYAVSCGALALLLVLFAGTAWQAYEPPVATATAVTPSQPTLKLGPIAFVLPDDPATHSATDLLATARGLLPNIVMLWLLGVALLSTRLAVTWTRAYRLTANTTPAAEQWQRAVVRLAAAMGLKRAVSLVQSTTVEVPSVIGWLRPVVLLPASALSGLSMEQVEMILAHELAHVRRHDFFVNFLQALAETLMFYHPAVWWISRQVRIEREHCCDDLAVAVCGKPLQYARALSRLEELRARAPELAVAANGGSLFERIKRIATRGGDAAPAPRWIAALAVLTVLGAAMAMPSMPLFADRDVPARAATSSIDVLPPEPPEPPDAPEVPEVPEFPEVPELPELPDIPEPPDAPGLAALGNLAHLAELGNLAALAELGNLAHLDELGDLSDLDVDIDIDPDIDIDHDFDIDIDEDLDVDVDVDDKVKVKVRNGVKQQVKLKQKDKILSKEKLTLDEIISLRAVGATPEYIAEMTGIFGDSLTLGTATALSVHGVNAAYVRDIRGAFGNDLDAGDILALRIHDLTPAYARQMRDVLGGSLTLKQLLPMKIHDVDPAFVREMRALFGNQLAVNEIVGLRIHDVSREYVTAIRSAGVDVKTAREAMSLQIADVDLDMVKQLAAAGYKNLSVRELVRLSHAGLTVRELEQYRKQ
ncbi:MAG TPA: M56 family metallopeptidase [Thermoanaerobaculia bacterium]